MTSRTVETVVHFASAFMFAGLDVPQPAEAYLVDRDEQLRTKTFILPAIDSKGPKQHIVPDQSGRPRAAPERERQL